MKKVISVLLALLMIFSVMSVGAVTAFAQDAETPVAAEEGTTSNARGAVSDYIPFSYECDYCGNTHEGFIGILFAVFHAILQAAQLMATAVKK